MTCATIALQNEKSGLVTIISYTSLVYAFFGDTVVFQERLITQELVGIAIILILNLALVF